MDVSIDLAVLSLRDQGAFAPALQIRTDQDATCFVGAGGDECIRVLWGSQEQFAAVLTLGRESGEVSWPRGKGWPTTVSIVMPEDTAVASLVFGDHEIALDLRGMTASVPSFDYQFHYPEFTAGSVLYDFDAKTITLDGVEQDGETGAVVLKLSAVNNSEATDFVPAVGALAARVTGSFLTAPPSRLSAGLPPK